jgi:purine-cytosine permease-like protein
MATEGEPRDDDASASNDAEESLLPSGPTRSTYKAPKSPGGAAPTEPPPPPADPVAVLYQLDDVAPAGVFGLPVEKIDMPLPGERILHADGSDPLAEARDMPSPDEAAVPVDMPPPTAEVRFERVGPNEPAAPSASPEPSAPPVFDLSDEAPPQPIFIEPTVGMSNDETPSAGSTPDTRESAADASPAKPELAEPELAEAEPAEPQRVQANVSEAAAAPPVPEFTDEPLPRRRVIPEPAHLLKPEPAAEPELADVVDRFADIDFSVLPDLPPQPSGPPLPAPPAPESEQFFEPTISSMLSPEQQAAELAKLSAPTSQPWVPQRKSLSDEALGALLFEANDGSDGALDVMQELERQVKLREEEAKEYQEWHDSMLEVGTPEAIAAVERVAPQFKDLVKADSGSEPTAKPEPVVAPDAAPPVTSDTVSTPVVRPVATTSAPPPPPTSAARSDLPPPGMPPAPPPVMPAGPPTGVIGTPPPPPAGAPRLDAPPPIVIAEPEPEPAAPHVPDAPPEPWAIPEGNVIPEEFERDVPPPPQQAQPQELVEPEPFGANPFVDAVHTGSIPVVTGSIPIPMDGLDVDDLSNDDAVDDTDQVSLAGIPHPATAPVEPILTPRVGQNETVLESPEPIAKSVGVPETATVAPTATDLRIGRAARMFWMWFAANSSLVSLAFGAMVFAIGMSLRQAMVGVVVGVAISLLPLGLSSLAGKRSGQPTMVISRAAFGRRGNALPSIVALVSRAFWGAALLWLLGQAVSAVLVGALLTGGLSGELISYIAMAVGFVIAVAVAALGYGVIVRLNLVISVLSGILIAGVVALTWQFVDFAAVIATPDADWLGAVTSVAVLVFSFLGLLWANSGADLARYQRSGASGAGSGALAAVGAALPAAVLMIYGTLLAASNSQLAAGFVENPFDTIGRMLPVWYPVPLIAAIALSLICGAVLTVYSGAFAFQSLSAGSSRAIAIVISAVVLAGLTALLVFSVIDMTVLFRDFATTIAVPVAAWAGIFAADTMIRTRPYDTDALLKAGGVYPAVRAGNVVLFIALTAVGFGLTSSTISWLSWQGYLISIVGLPAGGLLATSDIGVIVALVGGVLLGILTGTSGIKKQEAVSRRPQPESREDHALDS